MEHMKLPLAISDTGCLVDARGDLIGRFLEPIDAEFIIRACNIHYHLLAVVKGFVLNYEGGGMPLFKLIEETGKVIKEAEENRIEK